MTDEYYKNSVLGISNQQSSVQKRPKSNADNLKPQSHVEKANFVAPQQQLDVTQKKRAQSKEPEIMKVESPVKPNVKKEKPINPAYLEANSFYSSNPK